MWKILYTAGISSSAGLIISAYAPMGHLYATWAITTAIIATLCAVAIIAHGRRRRRRGA